jgi:hypothetical protein
MLNTDRSPQRVLDFYVQPAVMTSAGAYAPRFEGLPRDVGGLARVAQGLVIHEFLVGSYGVTLTDERRSSVHLRPVERILERLLASDDRPLTTARPADARLAGNNGRPAPSAVHDGAERQPKRSDAA